MQNIKGKKVLLVDDEEDIVELLQDALEMAGASIGVAHNGVEALKKLESESFAAIITDVRMPEMDGITLIREIRKKDKANPIIFMISGHEDSSPEQSYQIGTNAIFSKPFSINLLVKTLNGHLDTTASGSKDRSARLSAEMPVHIKFDDIQQFKKQTLLNISNGGIFVCLQDDLPSVGAIVSFSVEFPKDKFLFDGKGLVKWVRAETTDGNPSGVGVEFIELESEKFRYLLKFLKESGVSTDSKQK